jgi:DNA-directed RNA polymerase specialized sigma subunit, sigma24 homolog
MSVFCHIKENCVGCRSPPLVLHFQVSKIMKRRTSQMAKFIKKENYREKYPSLSNKIIEFLQKSDRKMEYQQYDLKVERYKIDYYTMTVTYYPSREDSYDRLLNEDKQFQMESESVEDIAVKSVMIERMMECLKTLPAEEQNLICELFFHGKSEHQLSAETGIPRMTLHDRKVKILRKLKKILEK